MSDHCRQRQLLEIEEQVHLIQSAVEQGFSAILIADASQPDPRILYVNPAFTQAIGCRRDDIVGHPLSRLPQLEPMRARILRGLPPGEQFSEGISPVETASGERLFEWRLSPVRSKTGAATHWLLISRDITERRRLEREILEISDRERQRLGQDLHDGLCQHLAGIELMSQVLQQKLEKRSKADAARAGEIARYVRDAIAQTRSLARGLSPVTLEAEGLQSALQELAANTEKMFAITCLVETDRPIPRCALGVGIHYYRIAQEAVANALKHGKATEIRIKLSSGPEQTILTIADNGSGVSGTRTTGMGLRIMRYRAGMLGGSLKIRPREPHGTEIICQAGPLSAQA